MGMHRARSVTRARVTAPVVGAVVMAAVIMGLASPAHAVPSVGTPSFVAPATVPRGGAPVGFDVTIPTSERATFRLAGSGADLTFSLPGSCTTDSGVFCTISGDTVVIGVDADANLEEPLNAIVRVSVSSPASVALTSTEGTSTMAKAASFTMIATGIEPTTGGTQTSEEAHTDIVAGVGDAVIDLVTLAPAGEPAVNRGETSTIVYTAALTRSGNLAQSTIVTVGLDAVDAAGTTLATASTQVRTFAPDQSRIDVSYTVNVPPSATPGRATYQFTATYDPTGTDGAPSDTETGDLTRFVVAAPNPTVTLSLSGSPTTGATVARGDAVTYTLTATNTAVEGASDATAVEATIPMNGDLVIGVPTASQGSVTVTGASPTQTVTVAIGTLAAGEMATVTIPVTVRSTATKTDGPSNDLVVGPPTGTFSPPAATAAVSSGIVRYEIRSDAGLSVVLAPATQTTAGPDPASITATVSNSGPDAADSTELTLTVTGDAAPGFVEPFPIGCVIDPTPTTLRCTESTIANGESKAYAVHVSQSGGGTATVSGTVSAASHDDDPTDNGPVSATIVATSPALSTDSDIIAFGSQPVGTSSTSAVVVTSDGTAPAVISSLSVIGTHAEDFAIVDDGCTGRTLDPAEACTIQVSFTPTATSARAATLQIVSNAPDSPDDVLLSGSGTARADVRISIGATPNPARNGDRLTYTVVARNNGPSAADAPQVTVTLSSSVQFDSITAPPGWTCSTPEPGTTGAIVCETTTLASDAAETFSVVVTIVAPGKSSISSTASISTSSFDPVLGDNSATATTAIKGKR